MTLAARRLSGQGLLKMGRVVLGPVLALTLMHVSGCGPSGVGSIDWADNPNARAVGAPSRLPEKPARPPGKTPKKAPEFIPG
jgi:hypothetical protein